MGVFIFLALFTIKSQVNAETSNIPIVVSNNIEALYTSAMCIDPIGRHCNQGCHVTDDPGDFCTQCGETECNDYLGREPIGAGGQCPVDPE